MKRRQLLSLAPAAWAAATPAAVAPVSARMGLNLAGPADWNTELPFVDVFRQSRPWISQRVGAGWGQGPALDLDEFGWVRRLEPGCYAETMLCTIAGGHYPAGVYTVLYEGEGTFAVGKNAKIVESAPGRLRVDVNATRGGWSLQLRTTNPEHRVHNLRVIMPGFETTWEANPFHPAFLARWKGVACFRFMDWMHTNGSEVRTWADRPTLRHATFSKRGVALEWMIELCNRQKADAWFCMPHMADDDYVHRFAQTAAGRLDPSLKVYIEYSNEVWNGQFAQSRYAGERGVELGLGPKERPWEAGWHFTAVRSVEIFRIWEEVLGGRDRLVRVLPVQSGVGAVADGVCGFREAARQADAMAVAPYMGYSVGRGKLADLAPTMRDWTAEQTLDHLEQTGFANAIQRMEKDRAAAAKYGLGLVAYEGGQHMVAFGKDSALVAALTKTMQACNRHPRMGDLYRRYFAEWARLGGGTFCHFSSIRRWSHHGAWGLAEYYDDTPADYPKWAAVLDTAAAWG